MKKKQIRQALAILCGVGWWLAADCLAAEPGRVTSRTFATAERMPALLPALGDSRLQSMVGYLPEDTMINLSICAGESLLYRKDEAETDRLIRLFATTYDQIYQDPDFAGVPSAISRLLGGSVSQRGHYFLYRPPGACRGTLLFLHGWGGNWLFYMWGLKEAFPDYAILAPSWGISWYDGPAAYLDEMWQDAAGQIPDLPRRSWLLGLSAGGAGGFRLYDQAPERYHGYICLASVPTWQQLQTVDPRLKVLMINGTVDNVFPIGYVRARAEVLKARLPQFQYVELPGDHFFFLALRQAMVSHIQSFIDQTER